MKITDITMKCDTRNTDILGYITFEDKNKDEITASLFYLQGGGYGFYHNESMLRLEAVKDK